MKHLFETPAVLYEGNFTVQYIGKVNGEHRLKINGVIYGYEASDTDAGKLQKMLKYSSGRALKWWKSVATHVSGGSKGTISETISGTISEALSIPRDFQYAFSLDELEFGTKIESLFKKYLGEKVCQIPSEDEDGDTPDVYEKIEKLIKKLKPVEKVSETRYDIYEVYTLPKGTKVIKSSGDEFNGPCFYIAPAKSLNETKINMSMKQFVDFRDKLVEGDLVPDYITFKVIQPFFAGTQESSISELKRVNFIFWNTLQANKKAYLEVPAGEYDIVFNEYNDRIDDFVIGFINAYGNTVNAYAIASKDFEKLPGINVTEYGLI